jgi:predicted RNase H-like HicB family nuclease
MIETENNVLNFTVLIEQAMERIKEAIQVCLEADDEEIM